MGGGAKYALSPSFQSQTFSFRANKNYEEKIEGVAFILKIWLKSHPKKSVFSPSFSFFKKFFYVQSLPKL